MPQTICCASASQFVTVYAHWKRIKFLKNMCTKPPWTTEHSHLLLKHFRNIPSESVVLSSQIIKNWDKSNTLWRLSCQTSWETVDSVLLWCRGEPEQDHACRLPNPGVSLRPCNCKKLQSSLPDSPNPYLTLLSVKSPIHQAHPFLCSKQASNWAYSFPLSKPSFELGGDDIHMGSFKRSIQILTLDWPQYSHHMITYSLPIYTLNPKTHRNNFYPLNLPKLCDDIHTHSFQLSIAILPQGWPQRSHHMITYPRPFALNREIPHTIHSFELTQAF